MSFSDFHSFKKRQKGVIFFCRNHGADVVHSGHVAGPREPTWTLVWRIRGAYVARGGLWAGR